jgi:cysteine-rich repeat protein
MRLALALVIAALTSTCTVFGTTQLPCDDDAQCNPGFVCAAGFCAVHTGGNRSTSGEGEGEGAVVGEGEGEGKSGEGEGEGAAGPVCGDDVISGTETCDDGNTVDGDGCSSSCQVESGFACVGVGPTSCADVDECLTQNGGCDPHAICTNTVGSRTCACDVGFTGDGETCSCTPQPGSLTPTPTIDEDCDGNVDNTTTELRWQQVSTTPSSVGDNGCAFTNLGVLGGTCTGCTGDTGCFIDGNGNVVPTCRGSGFGGRQFPGGQVQCALTTVYH